jgi:hypothetical protein
MRLYKAYFRDRQKREQSALGALGCPINFPANSW